METRMKNGSQKHPEDVSPEHEPYRIRLPGFLVEDVGLGDAIKRATTYIGMSPCGGCERRAEALNRRVVFSGRRTR
jgi:hypothetical protein